MCFLSVPEARVWGQDVGKVGFFWGSEGGCFPSFSFLLFSSFLPWAFMSSFFCICLCLMRTPISGLRPTLKTHVYLMTSLKTFSPGLPQMAGFPSFSSLNNTPLYMYTASPLLTHLWTDPSVVSRISAVVSKASVNVGVKILLWDPDSVSFGYVYPAVRLLGHIIVLF